MAISKDDLKKIRAANQRMIGGKLQYVPTFRNETLVSVLQFIETNYPDAFADAPAPVQAPAAGG